MQVFPRILIIILITNFPSVLIIVTGHPSVNKLTRHLQLAQYLSYVGLHTTIKSPVRAHTSYIHTHTHTYTQTHTHTHAQCVTVTHTTINSSNKYAYRPIHVHPSIHP